MSVIIIDYGMCNLGSVRRAFEECGADAIVSSNPSDLANADRVVLPGVGAFEKGMKNLKDGGWVQGIRDIALEKKVPLLGICLGMQLMSDKGYEGGEIEGLGLIRGEVTRLQPKSDERIPHIGWNEVCHKRSSALLDDIKDHTDFYFVHSYEFKPARSEDVLATTPYCGEFTSVVGRENILGVQFHPEKSQKPGFQIIRNFLRL